MDWMDPLDAAMVTVEPMSQPQHVAAVLILSPPDDAAPNYVDELYREALAATHPIHPRLRRYPYRGMDTRGMWVWRDAENLDVGQHVKRATLPTGAGQDGFWRLISELYAERLDRSLPMWMFYLIDGLGDGRFAFFVKVHHAVMDGVAGFRMIADALSADSTPRSMPPIYGAQHDEPAPKAAPARGRLPNPVAMVRSLINAATSSATLAERVVVGEVSNVIASMTTDTTVAPVAAPFTRFNGRTGDTRTVAAGSWPKSRIRAVQDKAGVTGNDAVVAVIAGVLRHWLRDHGELPEQSLVALCPITVRGRAQGADDEHGNMFGAWLCPLGTDLEDPAERLNLIHRSMAEGKQQVASRGSGASLLLLVPTQVTTVLLPKTPFPKVRTGYNVPISNIPGPRTEMFWNGAHVDDIYPIGTIYDGLALTVTVCSYADRISFGYLAGGDVMPDISEVIGLTERSLADLEAAVGVWR
ncbi:wax ester/triacylglycerol synthase family O-acyltransferase [Mycobacterium sp.]|uniref:wax ester/triacylglycerol synthase family O-acyltransferase n=1 Tax=Mycobacterium sp. TaxID=1785 RepID=UPI003F9E8081